MEKGYMEEYYEKQLVIINERNKLLRKAAETELKENAAGYVNVTEALKRLATILEEADKEAERTSMDLAEEVNKRLETERADRQKKATEMPF